MRIIAVYYILLLIGLGSMLVDGLGALSLAVYFLGMPLGAYAVGRSHGLRWRIAPALAPALARAFPRALFGAVIAFGLVTGQIVVMRLAGWVTLTDRSWQFAGLIVGLVAQQAVVASIEEFTFRGVIQTVLARHFGAGAGLGIAALLFGAFHLPNILYQDVTGWAISITLANLTLMGVVLGAAYQRGSALILPVALHFGWNVASFGVEWLYSMTFSGPELLTGQTAWFPESGLLGTGGLALLGAAAYALTRTTRGLWKGPHHRSVNDAG